MTDTLARWQEEHRNFARLLDLLSAELDRFHTGELPDYELMLDVMYYMTHYPDLFHHPVEELAFDRIETRDPGVAGTVARLREQHHWLRTEGEALVEILDDIVNGAIRARESVEGRARDYIARFRDHMTVEDTDLFPVASRLFGPAEWSEIAAAISGTEDPVFGEAVAERYESLVVQIGREARVGAGAP